MIKRNRFILVTTNNTIKNNNFVLTINDEKILKILINCETKIEAQQLPK